jgi:hypothetical protein
MRLVLIEVLDLKQGTYKSQYFFLGADGKDLRDFDNPLNDPKPYLLYGKYVEEY